MKFNVFFVNSQGNLDRETLTVEEWLSDSCYNNEREYIEEKRRSQNND